MLKIGHRGAGGHEPENTLASFKKALEFGVDMIELDVHLTKDNHLVVIHDFKLETSTSGKGEIKRATLEEIKQHDAGKGENVPTLQEALDVIDKKSLVNIELKSKGIAEKVIEVLNDYVENKGWNKEHFLISSFNHKEIKKIKKLAPYFKIGLLTKRIPPRFYINIGKKMEIHAINIPARYANRKFIENAHKNGMKVFIYTVNEPEEIEIMKNMGVDGIFSDYPDRL